jgi:2,3-bisphosphoglycerate-dependent phosphoglycerate mutase
VKQWRRSYRVRPPPISQDDPRYDLFEFPIDDFRNPLKDPKYSELKVDDLVLGESLEDVSNRVLPYWTDTILPSLRYFILHLNLMYIFQSSKISSSCIP